MKKLTVKQKKILEKVVKKFGLSLVLLFGSQVDGRTNRESDFDIAYKSDKPLKLDKEARLIIELAPIFRSENIDLVNLRRASALLLYGITRECQVLFVRDVMDFFTLRTYAFRRYVDEAQPLIKARYEALQLKLR